MSAEEVQKERERQREFQLHQQNLGQSGQGSREAAEALRYLSEIDDLPVDKDDAVMGQLVSKLMSTANLDADDLRSNEWVMEYLLLGWLARKPTEEGVHGALRAYVHDDRSAAIKPLTPEERLQVETFIGLPAKMAQSRSEDMSAIKEVMRNRDESFVHNDDDDEGGGLLGILS